MKTLHLAVAICGLLTVPSLAAIDVTLTADQTTLKVGDTTAIHLWGQGTTAGLFSLGGSITAAGDPGVLNTMVTSWGWNPLFHPDWLDFAPPKPGPNGGWGPLGSEQRDYGTPDAEFARAAPDNLFDYTVQATGPGTVTLSFTGGNVSGFRPLECDKTGVIGTLTPVTITVTPEPGTMIMLALGGLLIARRRRG